MIKKFFLLGIFLSSLLVLAPSYADTVILLNDNTIEGKIIEHTDKYIKIESSGVVTTYSTDDIKNIIRSNNSGDTKQASISEENSANMHGIKFGKWSITTTVQMEGLPAGTMEEMANETPEMKALLTKYLPPKTDISSQGITTTMTTCITNQIPFPFGDSKHCQETHEMNGDTVHYNATCTMTAPAGQETSINNGYVTYNGNSMEGEMKTQSNIVGKLMSETSHYTGEYLGPC